MGRRPERSAVLPADRMPRFAALLLDVATAYTVVYLLPWWIWASENATTVFILASPLLVVLWEALWLRLTGGTVGHWLTGIGLIWPETKPGYLTLCWRTVKRYFAVWMLFEQPSRAVPGIYLLGDIARPIAFQRVSRVLDRHGIVVSRRWPVAVMLGVFAVTFAVVPAAGFVATGALEAPAMCTVDGQARTPDGGLTGVDIPTPRDEIDRDSDRFHCPEPRMRVPLMIASSLWLIGGVVNATSVLDAWRTRHLQRPARRTSGSLYERTNSSRT